MADSPVMSHEPVLDRWPSMSKDERLECFASIPREIADDVWLELDRHSQFELLEGMPAGERRIWLRLLAPDDAADLVQLAPEPERQELLGELDETTRRETIGLLAYKEDAGGGLMNPRFARVRPEMTMDEAIAYLRRQAPEVETIYYAYALDDAQHLLGVVSFRDLFKADRTKRVSDVMRTDFIYATGE